METAKSTLEILDRDTEIINNQFTYFQSMREYVADLCDCLSTKVGGISEIIFSTIVYEKMPDIEIKISEYRFGVILG